MSSSASYGEANQKHMDDGVRPTSPASDAATQFRVEAEPRQGQRPALGMIASPLMALVSTDSLGIITDVNLPMAAMLGRTPDALVGTPFRSYVADGERADDGIRQVLAGNGVTHFVLTMQATVGAPILVSFSARTLRFADGRAQGIVATARDITTAQALEAHLRERNAELEEQYRRVQEANRLKSEFLANMSHELRTPLNAIIGFSQLLHDQRVGRVSPIQREYLGDILTSSQHLLQLINDVLDLAKVESGRLEFRAVPIELEPLIREVRTVLRSLAEAKRIFVGVEVAPSLTGIVGDPAKLRQVLYNYLANAVKFTPDGGRVTVRVRPERDDCFLLEVEDTGPGIEAGDVARLFVAFQQLETGSTTKVAGTGLGLALTQRVVEAQGGRVGVRSTPGVGSVFFAVLPRIGRAVAQRADGPSALVAHLAAVVPAHRSADQSGAAHVG